MDICPHAPKLSAYLDGELEEAEAPALEAHLRSCPACAQELRELRKLSALIGHWDPPAFPSEALESLHRSVQGMSLRRLQRLGLSLSALAACLAVATMLTPQSGASTPDLPPWAPAVLSATAEEGPGGTPQEVAMAQWIVADLSTGGR